MHMPPEMMGFKPYGIPGRNMASVTLLFDEFEAIKLADYNHLNQEDAAKKMNVSRPTFTRIYDSARKKIAQSFVEGKAILIEGGSVEFNKNWFKCKKCHETFTLEPEADEKCPACTSGQIELIYKKSGADDELQKFCYCIACNIKIPHKPGMPCKNNKCPECGNPLRRV